MKHPLPRIQTAVPRTLHAQLEIAKAIRTLAGQDEDGAQRWLTEIAAIRRDCQAAAGLDQRDVLSTIDDYAKQFSRFDASEKLDRVYTHSAQQDVEDTKRGYELYRSGRIGLRP
jgi:hypothetical protein